MNRSAFHSMIRRPFAAALLAAAVSGFPHAARASGGGGHGHAEPVAEKAKAVESSDGNYGVELGEFSVRSYRPAPMRRDEVIFTLHAVVKGEHYDDFERLYAHRVKKVRDQVIVATRLVPVDSYDDPQLTTLRRRILLRLRRALPELKIDDVSISEFHIRVEGV